MAQQRHTSIHRAKVGGLATNSTTPCATTSHAAMRPLAASRANHRWLGHTRRLTANRRYRYHLEMSPARVCSPSPAEPSCPTDEGVQSLACCQSQTLPHRTAAGEEHAQHSPARVGVLHSTHLKSRCAAQHSPARVSVLHRRFLNLGASEKRRYAQQEPPLRQKHGAGPGSQVQC